jgi:hypothetical protein
MSTQHTKGPWRVQRQNPSPTTGEWMISGAKPGYLAEVRDCGSGDVQANARLIAAAPDLLEALQNLFDADMEHVLMGDGKDDQIEAIAKARAAIAKATGAA